jgi:hypothetical protein
MLKTIWSVGVDIDNYILLFISNLFVFVEINKKHQEENIGYNEIGYVLKDHS